MTDAGARSSRPGGAELPLGRSLASNVVGVGWTAAMQLAFTPLFIRYVGVEGYGLIGFYITLNALLQVLDFGFAPTINRWLSRFRAGHEEARNARDFAKTLEIGSWLIAAFAGLLLAASAGTIARVWLRDTSLGETELQRSLMLMACTMAAQLPTTYYQSGLLGLRRPYEMNALRALAATASMGGAALILAMVSPTVTAYFTVHAVVGIVHAAALRIVFWRSLRVTPEQPARFRPQVLRMAWRFTAGMTAITIAAAIVAQVDRLIVIRLISLEEFGYYAVAWTVAGGLAVVSLPAMNTLFPRFSGIFASGDETQLRTEYHAGAQALSVLLLPIASVVALFAHPILAAWTGNPAIAHNAAPLAIPLTIGMALNGLMYTVYALQLATGATRLALQLTIVQMAIIVPLVTLLAWRYGALGAACAWPVLNALYFTAGSIVTFRRLLPGAWRDWIVRDVGVPLVAAIAVAATAWVFVPLPASRTGTILVVAAVLIASMTASAFATRTTREAILRHL